MGDVASATVLASATALAVSVDTVLASAKDTVLVPLASLASVVPAVPPVSAGTTVSATRVLTALVSPSSDPVASESTVQEPAVMAPVAPVFLPVRSSVATDPLLASVSVLPTAPNGERYCQTCSYQSSAH